MKLETYTDLSEKEKIFKSKGYLKIDTVAQFKIWYNNFTTEKKLFRGVNEAKFKIYTSAQRFYITHDLDKSGKKVEDVIEEELKQVKQIEDGLLKKYFDLLGVIDHDMLYLSFLQHYLGISPFIDFTTNVDKALFFMQDGGAFEHGGVGIDNYSSLFYKQLDPKKSVKRNISEDEIRKKYSFSRMICRTNNGMRKKNILFRTEELNVGKKNISSLANLNMIAQDGRFLFRCNDIKPLEKNISCVDIHKSIVPYIKKELEKKGITKESIYPQEEKIAQLALQRALENI